MQGVTFGAIPILDFQTMCRICCSQNNCTAFLVCDLFTLEVKCVYIFFCLQTDVKITIAQQSLIHEMCSADL